MLTPEQMEWMTGDGSNRAAMPWKSWPRSGSYVNIPYTKDDDDKWAQSENNNIQAAIDSYTENTCIRYCILTKMLPIAELTFE